MDLNSFKYFFGIPESVTIITLLLLLITGSRFFFDSEFLEITTLYFDVSLPTLNDLGIIFY